MNLILILNIILNFALVSFFKHHDLHINILDLGAIPNKKSIRASVYNSDIIKKAFWLANISKIKTVYIPNQTFYISSTYVENINNINFIIDGMLIAHNNIKFWPVDESDNKQHIFRFVNMNNFKIDGVGTIDGQGWKWWQMAILSATEKTTDNRPHMINIEQSENFELSGLTMLNSPKFHLMLVDVRNVHIHHFTIYVDVFKSNTIIDRNHLVPTFPLNTDGVDLAVTNASIHDFNITNFDDSIAIKPCNNDYKYCKCSSDILVSNGYVKFGVGMTIGSVQPKENNNCVNNVVFKDIYMKNPLKGIYVKTNRGGKGMGSITNITYKNITMDGPVWWAIYVGPQQQKQPDGSGEGCMKYPHDPNCPTEPKITMANITLANITVHNNLNPYPGLVRCNETNICKGINFYNVNVNNIYKSFDYICENAEIRSKFSNPEITDCNKI